MAGMAGQLVLGLHGACGICAGKPHICSWGNPRYMAAAAWAVFFLGCLSHSFSPGCCVAAGLAPAFPSGLKSEKTRPGWYLSELSIPLKYLLLLISLVCGRAPTICKQSKYSRVSLLISCDKVVQQLARRCLPSPGGVVQVG